MKIDIEGLMNEMTLEEKVSQMIYAGLLEDEVHWPNEETKDIITKCKVGAIRVYGSRYEPYLCAECINQLQKWAKCTRLGIPVLVGADLEAGASAVVRNGTTTFLSQLALGMTNSLELAKQVSRVIARESFALGIHMNQGPVADVNSNRRNPISGVGSYGTNTDEVCKFVEVAVREEKKEGLLTIVKHYPGRGGASGDSHFCLPTIDCDKDTFRRVHLKPFERAVRAGTDGVMTAHLIVKALDPEYPATLSYRIITEILREELGFDGLVITDNMNMRGITNKFEPKEATIRAVQAGVDLILFIGNFKVQLNRRNWIIEAVEEGIVSKERIDASVRRILRAKKRLGIFEDPLVDPLEALKTCGSKEHSNVAKNASLKGITVLKNANEVLPLRKESTVLVTGFKEVRTLGKELSKRLNRVIVYDLPSTNIKNWCKVWGNDIDAPIYNLLQYKKNTEQWQPTPSEVDTVTRVTRNCDVAIVTTFEYNPGQKKLLEEIRKAGSKIVVVSLGFPNKVEDLPECLAYLATYAQDRLSSPISEAIVDILLGKVKDSRERISHISKKK